MAQFVLLVYVTIIGTTNPLVYTISGQFTYEQCRAAMPIKVAEARQRFQQAQVTAQCLQLVNA